MWAPSSQSPLRSIVVAFAVWKTLLLLVAAGSPGPGYDTSTALWLHSHGISDQQQPLPSALHWMVHKLTRWDAIYFVTAAHRGYLFEQEWAFGWGFTRLISLCTAGLDAINITHSDGLEAVVAIAIAHVAHLCSALMLYVLTTKIFPGPKAEPFALTTALLHVIAPAGIFLSAPYAESSCALTAFAGYLLFVQSRGSEGTSSAGQDLLILLSGVLFGLSTTLRSNGILSGVLLLEEAVRTLFRLLHDFRFGTFRRLLATGLGGICVAIGFVIPQYIAYNQFCAGSEVDSRRKWCKRSIPSIYTFVQVHYWNNGFLRYWTLSNIPLFFLGAPMFGILLMSGIWAMKVGTNVPEKTTKSALVVCKTNTVLRTLAVSQLLLAGYTFTNAHVQIITRISSSCPVWVWYLAQGLQKGKSSTARNFVSFMVIYALVQGGLFALFLPPA